MALTKSWAQKMKDAIVADLEELVQAQVIAMYVVDNGSKVNPADYVVTGYPAAIVSAPDIGQSEYYDTATNLRSYSWYLLILTKPESIPANEPSYLEGLVDAVLDKFDQDITLQGMSNGGVLATTLAAPGPILAQGITFAGFYVTLNARQLVTAKVKSAS